MMGDSPGIKPVHYSTANLPQSDRHDSWTRREWPSVASLYESEAVGEFSTRSDHVVFDGITVSYGHGTARTLDRTADKIASDGLDVLGIGVVIEGEMVGDAGARAFHAVAGDVLALDMGQPSTVSLSISSSIQVAVPRTKALEAGIDVAGVHGLVLHPPASAMLGSHIVRLRDVLAQLSVEDEPRVARTLLDLLILAIRVERNAQSAPIGGKLSAMARRARHEVRQNLGSSVLTVASLCRRLQVSRSTLHRLFEEEGGVQTFIRNARLEAAHLALLDPENGERIGDLSERLGFSDAAHLSRLFRARYGESPSQCRQRAVESQAT